MRTVLTGIAKLRALPPLERSFAALAWILAPAASLLVLGKRFGPALAWLGRSRREPCEYPTVTVTIERGESLVCSVFEHQLSVRSCLPRAIVQFAVHRRLGPAPKLVIGVKRANPGAASRARLDWNLDAHAWVEPAQGPSRDVGYVPILSFSDLDGLRRENRAEGVFFDT